LIPLSGQAQADPISIGSSIGLALFTSGVPVAGFTATSAFIVGSVAIGLGNVALSLGINALSAQRGQQSDPSRFKQNFSNPEGPEINAVGRCILGGLFNFRNATGLLTFRSVLHCAGPVDATEAYYIGGREVVVDRLSGDVESPPWSRVGQTYLRIFEQFGDGTETAWSQLITAFPNLWTINHQAKGIAQSLVEYRSPGTNNPYYLTLYGAAEVRNDIKKKGRWQLIYDPRDATQHADYPNTWKWTRNGILCSVHIMRKVTGLPSTRFDWADIALEASKADALVPTRTGYRPRSTISGSWGSNGNDRSQVVIDAISSAGAEITEGDDGLQRIRLIDDERIPEITFSGRHIISNRLHHGPEGVERPNICRVHYLAPERGFEVIELPLVQGDGTTPLAWSRIDDEIEAYGKKPFDVRLPFCDSASQAQQIARRLFLTARSESGVATMNFAGMAAWGKRVADIPFVELNDDGTDEVLKCVLGDLRPDDKNGTVEIPYVVQPDMPNWDPAADEALPLPELPEIQFESELGKPLPPYDAAVKEHAPGEYRTYVGFLPVESINGGAPASIEGVVGAEANVRFYVDGQPGLWMPMEEEDGRFAYASDGNDTGRQAEFRFRVYNAQDDVSYFSDTYSVNALTLESALPPAPVVTGGTDLDGTTISLDVTITPAAFSRPMVIYIKEDGAVIDVRKVSDATPYTFSKSEDVGHNVTRIYSIYSETAYRTISTVWSQSASTPPPG